MNLWAGIAMGAALLGVRPACGQTFTRTDNASGLASDGDTLRLNGTSYRLWGIDAPELHQRCGDDWPAGIQAQESLEYLRGGGKMAAAYRENGEWFVRLEDGTIKQLGTGCGETDERVALLIARAFDCGRRYQQSVIFKAMSDYLRIFDWERS
jgi:hypothetical protein